MPWKLPKKLKYDTYLSMLSYSSKTKIDDIDQFIFELDNKLQSVNTDYAAKRYKNMTIQMPVVHIANNNLFHNWLKQKGKLGGQNKVPRLSNNRDYIDELLELNKN